MNLSCKYDSFYYEDLNGKYFHIVTSNSGNELSQWTLEYKHLYLHVSSACFACQKNKYRYGKYLVSISINGLLY